MSDFRRAVADRLTGLGLRPEREAEIVEELTQHLDDAVREMTAAGVEPAEARAAALAGLDAPGELARHLAGIEVRPARALPPPGPLLAAGGSAHSGSTSAMPAARSAARPCSRPASSSRWR